MSTALVLTVIGKDRPGLVEAISQVVSEHDANWDASHMARIGGRFAGILQVVVAEGEAKSLAAALEKLGPSGLRVIVEDSVETTEPQGQVYWIELIGSDHHNIVRDISAALASREVTVLELNSELSDAPVAGGRLFKMQASIRCPESLSGDDLRESLEGLANSLMVDIEIGD